MVHNHNALTCRNKTLATLWQPPGVFSSFVVSETSKSGHPWTGRLQRSVSSVMTMAPRGLLSTLNLEVLISKPSQKQMLGTDSPFSALAWQWPQGEDAQWADSCPSAPPPLGLRLAGQALPAPEWVSLGQSPAVDQRAVKRGRRLPCLPHLPARARRSRLGREELALLALSAFLFLPGLSSVSRSCTMTRICCELGVA